MNWLKRLFGAQANSKDKGGNITWSVPPGKTDNETSFLRLCCNKCGARYSVGEDALLVTMDMTKEMFDKSVIITLAESTTTVKKDLVSLVSGVSADRRASVLTQALSTAQSVIASLKNKQKRAWICYKCKALNNYPGEDSLSVSNASLSNSADEPLSASAPEDVTNIPFLECSGNDASELTCSDRACPCGNPGTDIPRGQGYLFIWKELIEFRKDFLNDDEMRSDLANGRMTASQRSALQRAMATAGSAYPILMCEQGARARGLNLEVAAADAARWWETGRVPLRPTPFATRRP